MTESPINDVISIGNIVVDLIVTGVNDIPDWGQLIDIKKPITLNIGGNAAIFSACASALGLRTSIFGKIGSDFLGTRILEMLSSKGVDTSFISTDSKEKTSTTVALVNIEGERCFFHYIGANASLKIGELDLDHVLNSKGLLLCSYFIMPGYKDEEIESLLRKAKKKGVITFFDVAWDPQGKWKLGEFMKYVDVFLPNLMEAQNLTGEESVENCAKILLDLGPKIVTIKMGKNGCYTSTENHDNFFTNPMNVNAIDTTGAGDAFNAAFAYAHLNSWDMKKTVEFANAAGALSVQSVGGATALPTVEKIKALMSH